MVRYPIGIQGFEKLRQGGYLYVDKTAEMYAATKTSNYIFLSRPRRFGKSLLTSTLEAYFRGKKELFKGLAVEKLEQEWKQYPVLHFDFSDVKEPSVEVLNQSINSQLRTYETIYSYEPKASVSGIRLAELVHHIYDTCHEQVVILIDEYDAPMVAALPDNEKLEMMRQEMLNFYGVVKKLDPYLRFFFMTGITKFSQLSIFSGLNNLKDISMLWQFSSICGMTQEELEANFQEGIDKLMLRTRKSRTEILSELKRRYDGYHFSEEVEGVYNPFSLLNAMQDSKMGYYWFSSGTPTFLIKMMQHYHTYLPQLEGSKADAEELNAPLAGMPRVLPLFYQSGYLTIKDYDPVLQNYILGYPNEEIKVGLLRAFIPYYVHVEVLQARDAVGKMYEALLREDMNEALHQAQIFFSGIPYQEGTLKDAPTSEGHFTAMLYVMFSFLNLYVYSQVRDAKGRLDILVKTATTIYIMELKLDGTVKEALEQIDNKNYAIPYEADGRKIVKVGINFSSEDRTLTDWKIIGE